MKNNHIVKLDNMHKQKLDQEKYIILKILNPKLVLFIFYFEKY